MTGRILNGEPPCEHLRLFAYIAVQKLNQLTGKSAKNKPREFEVETHQDDKDVYDKCKHEAKLTRMKDTRKLRPQASRISPSAIEKPPQCFMFPLSCLNRDGVLVSDSFKTTPCKCLIHISLKLYFKVGCFPQS